MPSSRIFSYQEKSSTLTCRILIFQLFYLIYMSLWHRLSFFLLFFCLYMEVVGKSHSLLFRLCTLCTPIYFFFIIFITFIIYFSPSFGYIFFYVHIHTQTHQMCTYESCIYIRLFSRQLFTPSVMKSQHVLWYGNHRLDGRKW